MSKPNYGGPAFPSFAREADGDPGMWLRDWFAGQALAGYLTLYAGEAMPIPDPEEVAVNSYRYADAMLAERAKGGGP